MKVMRGRITEGGIYHVLSRGVDKRRIFLCKGDYLRFIHDLFEFNDENSALNIGRYFTQYSYSQLIDVRRQSIGRNDRRATREPRKCLVEVLAFCLMPNHYHFLLRAKSDTSIAEFMKKINGGYAKYFNLKYERTGTLFSSRYKSVPVTNESHFIHLPYYIHMNPLDLITPEWRKRELTDYRQALRFLENYRWSSYLDYIGKKNFPSVTQRDFLSEFFGGPKEYRKSTRQWLKGMNWENIRDLTLEDGDSN